MPLRFLNKNEHTIPQRGFIALISTILIATILVGLAVGSGESALIARYDTLNAEYQSIARGLADSCADVALLKLAQHYAYTGNESGIVVGTDGEGRPETCAIGPLTFPNGNTGVQNTVVVTASAVYPPSNGANSSVTVSATVQNPAFAAATLPSSISVNAWSPTP